MNSNRGHPHLSDCFIPGLNTCSGNDEIKNVEVENNRFKISFRSSPFHCQYSVMKNKTISHNWLALLFAHIDTGSPITEYPVRGKKTRLVFYGRFTRKKEISTTMPYVRVFQLWSRCLRPQNLRKIISLCPTTSFESSTRFNREAACLNHKVQKSYQHRDGNWPEATMSWFHTLSTVEAVSWESSFTRLSMNRIVS